MHVNFVLFELTFEIEALKARVAELEKEIKRGKDIDSMKSFVALDCWCAACDRAHAVANNMPPIPARINICPDCGDKRCPHAINHEDACELQT